MWLNDFDTRWQEQGSQELPIFAVRVTKLFNWGLIGRKNRGPSTTLEQTTLLPV